MSSLSLSLLLSLSLYTYITNGYYLSSNYLTWKQSSLFCETQCNSNLASIHNKSQNDEMIESIQSGHTLIHNQQQSQQVFIGFYDNITISNYKWIDGTPFDFGSDFYKYPWLNNPAQPNSIDAINCGQIRVSNDYGWDDVACSRRRRALCNSCSGKLNKYIILTQKYDYIDADIQCSTQIGTSLASMHSERDFIELQRLCQLLYDKPSDCWIGLYHDHNMHQNGIHWKWIDDTPFDYGNFLDLYPWNNNKPNGDVAMLTVSDKYLLSDTNITNIAYPICNIPSELCTNVSRFAVFNGNIIFKDCKAVSIDNNGRNEAIIIDKQYVNEDRIVLIDYIFKIYGDEGRGGILLPISTCSAYYIGISLIDKNEKLFVQYIEYNESNTDYDVLPLIQTNLQFVFDQRLYHLLSVEMEQIVDRIKLTVSINNNNHFEVLVCEHSVNIDLYAISVGIWSENVMLEGKSLYISGTPINIKQPSVNTHHCLLSRDPIITSTISPNNNRDKTASIFDSESIISYGIVLTMTFYHDYKLNINDTRNMIEIVEEMINTLTNDIICNDMLNNINIQLFTKYDNEIIINGSIFVCNADQQKQLLSVFKENQINIQQQIEYEFSINSTQFEMDRIVIYHDFITTSLLLLDTINDNKYYGQHGNNMGIILLFIVSTLAITSVIAVCAIFALHCYRLGVKKREEIDSNRINLEMNIDENKKSLSISNLSKATKKKTLTDNKQTIGDGVGDGVGDGDGDTNNHTVCIERVPTEQALQIERVYTMSSPHNQLEMVVNGGRLNDMIYFEYDDDDDEVFGSLPPEKSETVTEEQEQYESKQSQIINDHETFKYKQRKENIKPHIIQSIGNNNNNNNNDEIIDKHQRANTSDQLPRYAIV